MQSPFISITASTPGSDEEMMILPSEQYCSPPYESAMRNGGHPFFPQTLPAAIMRRHSSTETTEHANELKSRTNSLPRLHHAQLDEVGRRFTACTVSVFL